MIEYIKGEIEELTPTNVVLDKDGVGYFVNISIYTFENIRSLTRCKLYIYEAIREDAYVLYGFSTQAERILFLQLLGVSGVGANTARMILSSFNVPELQACIVSGNAELLKSVKGIGLKTAQRIIIDLKDKIAKGLSEPVLSGMTATYSNTVKEEAIAALQMLGFLPAASTKVVTQILMDAGDLPVEKVIKTALKML